MNWLKKLWEYLEGREPDYTEDYLNDLRRMQFHYKAKYLQIKVEIARLEKELKK